MEGKIIKGIGGFYYIHTREGRVFSCRAVGIFRKLGIKPLPGDNADFDIIDEQALEGSLSGIHQRKNVLIRPAVANVDQAMIVFALREPDPNFGLLDRFLIYMAMQDIPVTIYFNKADLDDSGLKEVYRRIYEKAGYRVISGSTNAESTIEEIKNALKGKTTVLAGPSGVGKSSLTNRLFDNDRMEVGELSRKIKRGRQTTRHTELFSLDEDSYLLDTPGFTSLYLSGIEPGELDMYFNEFAGFIPECRFAGCSHIKEAEDICAVKRAALNGLISMERYKSYVQIYEELKTAQHR